MANSLRGNTTTTNTVDPHDKQNGSQLHDYEILTLTSQCNQCATRDVMGQS